MHMSLIHSSCIVSSDDEGQSDSDAASDLPAKRVRKQWKGPEMIPEHAAFSDGEDEITPRRRDSSTSQPSTSVHIGAPTINGHEKESIEWQHTRLRDIAHQLGLRETALISSHRHFIREGLLQKESSIGYIPCLKQRRIILCTDLLLIADTENKFKGVIHLEGATYKEHTNKSVCGFYIVTGKRYIMIYMYESC